MMKKRISLLLWQLACMAHIFLVCGILPWEPAVETTGYVQEKKKIAITFDDGPSVYTETLLEGLRERGVKATFFLIGKNAELYPKIVEQIAEQGHLIGNHTYNHVEITKISEAQVREEVEKTNRIIEAIQGKPVEYIRPPFGLGKEELEKNFEISTVMWTVDPLDWMTENVEEIVNKVVTEAEENDIILLHDCYASSVEAALQIIDRLEAQGFVFVTVDELLFE